MEPLGCNDPESAEGLNTRLQRQQKAHSLSLRVTIWGTAAMRPRPHPLFTLWKCHIRFAFGVLASSKWLLLRHDGSYYCLRSIGRVNVRLAGFIGVIFKLSNSLSLPRFEWLLGSLQTLVLFHAPWQLCHTAMAPAPGQIVSVLFNFLAFAEHGITDAPFGSALLEIHAGYVFTGRRFLFAQSYVDQIVPYRENKQCPVNVHHMTQHAGGSRGEQKNR